MLQTINISLPKSLAGQVDKEVESEGYVSRSEFFRTLIRIYFMLIDKGDFVVPFKRKPIKEIKKGLYSEGYSEEFVSSVAEGLEKSSYYK